MTTRDDPIRFAVSLSENGPTAEEKVNTLRKGQVRNHVWDGRFRGSRNQTLRPNVRAQLDVHENNL